MVSNIGNFFKPQNTANKAKNEAELSVFYMNDVHGDINRAAKMKTAKDYFSSPHIILFQFVLFLFHDFVLLF